MASAILGVAAGRLRDQITIQQQTGSRGSYGQLAETWAAVSGGTNVWAEIEPLGGREQILAQSNQATLTHRITLRTIAGVTITPRMRVVSGSRTWHIVAVRESDGGYLTLDAVEVA